MAFYKKRIVRQDTQADVDWRLRNNLARDQARKDTKAKFPVVTADNFADAVAYQDQRVADLMKQMTRRANAP
jgi:hypothetical protein